MDTIEKIRSKIASDDEKLLRLISHRMHLTRAVAEYKRDKKLFVRDKDREDSLLKSHIDIGNTFGLKEDLVRELFAVIFRHSCELQEDLITHGRF